MTFFIVYNTFRVREEVNHWASNSPDADVDMSYSVPPPNLYSASLPPPPSPAALLVPRVVSRVAPTPQSQAAKPNIVFHIALDRRYPVYRIPTLLSGSYQGGDFLLAFAEARPTVDDHGRIDLVMRRSADSGRTWSALEVVVRSALTLAKQESIGNPVPIYLAAKQELLLLYCSNPAMVNEDSIRAGLGGVGRRIWLIRSSDLGFTWSAPAELTSDVKLPGWNWYATGPGGALVSADGKRVTVPATHSAGAGLIGSGLDHSHLLLSRDAGATWELGADAASHTNEATIAQLPDGGLLLNARSLDPSRRRRVLQRSEDGGLSWGAPWHSDELTEPPPRGCHGSMVATEGGALFFTGLASALGRARLALWRSDDGGGTWRMLRVLHAGPAAYSSMRLLPDGTLGVLYERGETAAAFFAQRIVFEKVAVELFEHLSL